MKLQIPTTLLMSLALLTACDKSDTEKTVNQETTSEVGLSSTMEKAATEARIEILKGNMSLSGPDGAAKAEITPEGDLLIDGKPVTITIEQRQMLVTHRKLLATLAINGMEIGLKGVDLAGEAIGEAVKGVFTGDTGNIEKKVEAKAEKIEASAKALCEQLPLLMASQDKLAASLPEFKPYATMTTDDINDCHTDTVHKR